jgi:hypothetical protein
MEENLKKNGRKPKKKRRKNGRRPKKMENDLTFLFFLNAACAKNTKDFRNV